MDDTASMSLDDAELAKIKTSGTVVFESIQGEIKVSSVTQHATFTQALTASIQITTQSIKSISFVEGESTFRALTVNSGGGVLLQQNIRTTHGNLAITTGTDHLAINSSHLESGGTITVAGFGTTIDGNSNWDALGSISVSAQVNNS